MRNPQYQLLTDQELGEIDAICDRFDRELLRNNGPRIEQFLQEVPEGARNQLLAELLSMEFEFRTRQGNKSQQNEYLQRFPDQQDVIARVFAAEAAKHLLSSESTPDDEARLQLTARTHHKTPGKNEIPTIMTGSTDSLGHPDSEGLTGQQEFRRFLEPPTRPGWLGRLAHFEIEKILGQGAFGIVAKAYDEKLHRVVAIKMLMPDLATTSPPRQRFLREARAAAGVTQENIVTIYDTHEEPIPFLVM